MGFLVHIFLAAGALVLGTADMTLGVVWPWAAPVFLAMPYALVFAARRATFSRRTAATLLGARLATIAGPLSYLALVWTTGWVQAVRDWTGADLGWTSWPEPSLALAFAPFLVLQGLAIDAESRAIMPRSAERRRWRAFQLRMFLSALVPPGLYFAAAMLVGTSDVVRAHVEYVQMIGFAFLGVLLVILAVNLPTLLRGTWETVPLPPGAERDLFDRVAERAGFRAREVLLWRTGNMMANAAIVGLTPGRRVVLLSDSLLAALDLRGLSAVYGHEIGHSQRHHVPIFCAWFGVFLIGAMAGVEALEDPGPWLEALVVGGAVLLWALCFGWLSRRFELEADLYAADLIGDPGAMVLALETTGGRLRDVAGWRHFSTKERVDFLVRATTDPVFRRNFQGRMRFLGRLGVVLGVLVLALHLFQLGSRWSADKVHADLALGRYASATQRAAKLEDVDEDFRGLLARAATLEDRAELAQLEGLLESAYARRDWTAMRDWADLLHYRGQVEFGRMASELDEAIAEGREPRIRRAEDDPPRRD